MPIHGLASLLSSSPLSKDGSLEIPIPFKGTSWQIRLTTIHLATLALFAIVLWWIKSRWVNGKKCGWERDWKGKMVWIVVGPDCTPDTYLRANRPDAHDADRADRRRLRSNSSTHCSGCHIRLRYCICLRWKHHCLQSWSRFFTR